MSSIFENEPAKEKPAIAQRRVARVQYSTLYWARGHGSICTYSH